MALVPTTGNCHHGAIKGPQFASLQVAARRQHTRRAASSAVPTESASGEVDRAPSEREDSDMNIMMLVFIAVVILSAVVAVALKGRQGESPAEDSQGAFTFRLEAKPYFFSMAENRFYAALVSAAQALDLVVFPKVGLNDVFKDSKDAEKGQYNRYAQMHVDYLLVTQKDYKPVAGVELDGASHQGEKQQVRDQKKAAAFKAAKLPLLRFYNQEKVNEVDLRTKLGDVLGSSTVCG